jgi:DNA-3-methyladenine glycosylase
MAPLPRGFYARGTVEVARALLGKVLVHGKTAGRIVEVEAYLGEGDEAAHSARGLTPRTRVIFGPPGNAYVYLIYGMYECLNIVAEPEGKAGCVLLRALEPVAGLALMKQRRGNKDLCGGPGKLTQAMGITRDHYGADLTRGPLRVEDWPCPEFEIAVTPRVGINVARDFPLRFFIKNNPHVSRQ